MTAKEQTTALIAHFRERRWADQFIHELKRAGFKEDEIGLIASQHEGEAEPVEEGALAGALSGGAVGALAGAAATGIIPGIGPVVAGGLLAGVLGGAAAGATAGGLLGGLIGLGIPEDEARKFEREFLAGRTLVVVQAIGRGGDALSILNHCNQQQQQQQRRTAMHVHDVMTAPVRTIHPDAPLQEAAERMRSLDVGPLPVCENNRVIGMITDRDITVRATAEGMPPKLGHVRDVMTKEVICCFEDQDVEEAAQLMKEKQLRRLVVVNRKGRLVGIVSLGDLAVETHDEHLVGETLEKVSL